MKKLCNIALGLLAFFTTLVVLLCVSYNYFISSVDKKSNKNIPIEIKKGDTVTTIGKLLKKNNLIKNDVVFKIYVKLNNSGKFKAGYYSFSKNMDVKTIVETLEKGSTFNPNEVVITFNEGINIEKIADIIATNTANKKEEVLNILDNEEYIDSLINKYWFLDKSIKNVNIYYPLEGYLYPNTYKFKNKEVTIKEIFTSMLNETDKVLSKYKDKIEEKNYSVHELLTVASMAELEGVTKEDRAGITSVFYNRLNKNMSMGSDVTTYYAFKVNMSDRDLTTKEFNTYNAYNTRGPNMSGKLPIGPICNPSKDSIDAAVYPAITDNYYFVADKNRKVYFTKNSNEHNAVISKLKKEGLWLNW